jgi:hypothetical protein
VREAERIAMDDRRFPTIGEIIGLDKMPTADGRVLRAFLDLDDPSEEEYRKLSVPERYLYDVYVFNARVMNGGIHEYLSGSWGHHWSETIEALQAIGARRTCEYLRRACQLFPDSMPSMDPNVREQQMREIALASGKEFIDDLIEPDYDDDLKQLLWAYWEREGRHSTRQ